MLNHEHEDVVAIISKMNPHALEEDVLEILRACNKSMTIRDASDQLLRSVMSSPRQPYIDEIQQIRDMVDVALYSLKVSGRVKSYTGRTSVEEYSPVCRSQEIEDKLNYMRRILKGYMVRPTGQPDKDPKILIDAPLSILYPLILSGSTNNFIKSEREELVE